MSLLKNLRNQRRQHLEDRLKAAKAELSNFEALHSDLRNQITTAREELNTQKACELNLEATRLLKQIVLKSREVDELHDQLSRI